MSPAPRNRKLGNFYAALEQFLLQQLQTHPELLKLRIELLELYFETVRPDDFLREAQTFAAGVKDRATSREWRNVAAMGRMLLPEEPLFKDRSGDTVAYTVAPAAEPPQKIRRFGEDKRYARYFRALAAQYARLRGESRFLAELDRELIHTAGRPSSLYHARRLSEKMRGAQIHLKREDLAPAHTHLTIAIAAQGLLARQLGRAAVVIGTVDGARGVIAASVAMRLGLRAVVYMDGQEAGAQTANVFRLWLMGAELITVDAAAEYGGDVRCAALRHWAENPDEAFLITGLDAAPEPYPQMARDFSSTIGRECHRQCLALTRRAPDVLLARVGHNADAVGYFEPFLPHANTRLVGVETWAQFSGPENRAAKSPADASAARPQLTARERQIASTMPEPLDFPSVTREQAWLRNSGRVHYMRANEDAARKAITDCAQLEGLIPAIETAQVIAVACQEASRLTPEQSVIVMMAEKAETNIWDIGKAMGVPI